VVIAANSFQLKHVFVLRRLLQVYCPMSKKPLKLKDLIPVKFTPIADRDKKTSLIAKEVQSFLWFLNYVFYVKLFFL